MNSIFAPGHHWALCLLFSWLYHQQLWGFPYGHPQETTKKQTTNWHNERKATPNAGVHVGCSTVCCSQGVEKCTFKTTESNHHWPPHTLFVWLRECGIFLSVRTFPISQLWLVCKYTDMVSLTEPIPTSRSLGRSINTQSDLLVQPTSLVFS